jgi:hypothetical protein
MVKKNDTEKLEDNPLENANVSLVTSGALGDVPKTTPLKKVSDQFVNSLDQLAEKWEVEPLKIGNLSLITTSAPCAGAAKTAPLKKVSEQFIRSLGQSNVPSEPKKRPTP